MINNNDMNPVFDEMSYTGNISEAADENEFVLLVRTNQQHVHLLLIYAGQGSR